MADNQVAFVTGGARRLGAGFVEHLAKAGWEVVIHYNGSAKEAITLSEKLQLAYPERTFPLLQADLAKWQNLNVVLEGLKPVINRIDLLVNNASVFEASNLRQGSVDHMMEQFGINFFAPVELSKLLVTEYACKQVVNLLDTKIVTNDYSHAYYLLAKKGLADFTKMAAKEWGPSIRVNGIAPGPVLPPAGESMDYLKGMADLTPLKEVVSTTSLAEALDFFIRSQHITGQIIYCDSGSHVL